MTLNLVVVRVGNVSLTGNTQNMVVYFSHSFPFDCRFCKMNVVSIIFALFLLDMLGSYKEHLQSSCLNVLYRLLSPKSQCFFLKML